MSLDVLLILLGVFLLLTLVISFLPWNRKVSNFEQHAIGYKQFSTATIVASIVATHCTGPLLKLSILHAPMGVWYIAYRISITLFPLLLISWLSGYMKGFMSNISMPETMASSYGSYGRLITSLFEIANAIIIISLQIHVISNTVSRFMPSASPLVITILITVIILVYAMYGGERAIALTDVWQCVVFATLIILLAWLVFKKIDKPIIEIIHFLKSKNQFELHNLIPLNSKIKSILRYLSFSFGAISPYLIHNVYISSSPNQARKAFLYAGIFCTAIVTCMLTIGLFIFIWFPDIKNKYIWDYFLSHSSPILGGMVCFIIISCAMSTVDSRLHVLSIIVGYEILRRIPLLKRFVQYYQLLVIRIALFALALLTLVLAFNCSMSMLMRILVWYGRFYVPIIMAPFILLVLGFRTTYHVFLVGIFTGLLSVFAWHRWIFPIIHTDSSHFPCMLMNGLSMILAHYLPTKLKKIKKYFRAIHSI
ncbi:sodium:solute symporter family protein [Candidatus Cardinium hertigii]|uniref:sodium:solute symporter family protein n=1 Tax=Candidatus Cardinium hertigii TaxID=247481 RepID=UPI003D7DE4CE